MNNYAAISVKNPKKSKCGDACFADKIIISDNEYILLIVADGVSRAPKDWLASSSTIAFILEELKNSNMLIEEALKYAIEIANKNILRGIEDAFGMLSTLSIAVISEKDKKLWWSNVGDSRIFGFKRGCWQQFTIDDSTSIPYKENGKLKLRDGVPIMMNALTKAIGQSDLVIRVTEITTEEYEAFALASDGFYGLDGFERYTSLLINQIDINKAVNKLQETILPEITDDASIAIVRLETSENNNLKEMLFNGDSERIPIAFLLNNLESEISNAIIEKDIEYSEKLINLMINRKIFYEKPKMIKILELMIKYQSPHCDKITRIIRIL